MMALRTLLRAAYLAATLCTGLASVAAHGQNALLPPDWVQLGTRGADAAVSEDGQRWMVGTDGRAYRWNEAGARWISYGSRSDLARIDAGRDGAAALSRSGELLVTGNAPQGEWRPTGMQIGRAHV